MAYTLSQYLTEQKNIIASDKAWLVALEIDVRDFETTAYYETRYIVNNTESVTYNGNVYEPYAFEISLDYTAGGQTDVSVTIQDVSRAIQAYLQEYKGGVGFHVRLIVLNEGALDQPSDIVEHFEVVSTSSENYNVTFSLGTQNLLNRKFPNRRQLRDRCAWRFKSAECGYDGSQESCDYSLRGINGCKAKDDGSQSTAEGNVHNYGGFPGIMKNGFRYV